MLKKYYRKLKYSTANVQFFAPKFLIADIFITIIGHSGHLLLNLFPTL